ncbi:hypothetical protein AAC387_Pa03g0826 [Persea americana]
MSALNPAPESDVEENQIPTVAKANPADEKPLENQPREDGGETVEGNDDEEAECGFCLFMKGGGCKEEFIAWEQCVEEAEKNREDIVDKCFEVTALLKKCMDAHSDYYGPILRAEKAMEEEAAQELVRVSPSSEAQQ